MMIRPTAAFALAVCCGCVTPQEDIAQLADFKQRAARYHETGDLGRAEQQARMGLALDPDHAILNLLLGRTLLKWHDLRSVARSRPYLEKAYDLQPEFRTSYSLGEFHQRYAEFLIGESNLISDRADQLESEDSAAVREMRTRADNQRSKAKEHLNDARQLLEEALGENPTSIYALRLAANCYVHQQEDELALSTLAILIKELGDSRDWKNSRLASDGSIPIPEEVYLRNLVSTELRIDLEARGLAATIHKNAGRYANAEALLTGILKLDPDMVREYFNRGMCRYWQGNLSGAATDMTEFIRRTSLSIDAQEVERALDIVAENETVKA